MDILINQCVYIHIFKFFLLLHFASVRLPYPCLRLNFTFIGKKVIRLIKRHSRIIILQHATADLEYELYILLQPVPFKRFFRCNNFFLLLVSIVHLPLQDSPYRFHAIPKPALSMRIW